MDIQKMPASSPHELLTLEETAALLKVSKSWIYERTRKGAIPHLKLGKYLRFPLADLLRWATSQRRQAKEASLPSRGAELTVFNLKVRRRKEVIALTRTAQNASHGT